MATASNFTLVEVPNFGHKVENPDDVWWTDNFCIHEYTNVGEMVTDIFPSDSKASLFVPMGPPSFFSNKLDTTFTDTMFLSYHFPFGPAPFIQDNKLSTLAHYSRPPAPIVCCNKPTMPYFLPPLVAIYNSMNKLCKEAMFFVEESLFMLVMAHLERLKKELIYIPVTNSEFKISLCNPLAGLDHHRVTSPDEDRMFGCFYSARGPPQMGPVLELWE